MKKLTLNEFTDMQRIPVCSSETLEFWQGRSFYVQMMDIWGQASSVIKEYENDNAEAVKHELSNFSNLCCIIYANQNISEGAKWELNIAEWELMDFCLWDNEWNNDAVSVMKWFDQWCYDINYDLL